LQFPNPEFAPYGLAAKKALLERAGCGSRANQIVYCENVSGRHCQFAESRHAEAVITIVDSAKGKRNFLPLSGTILSPSKRGGLCEEQLRTGLPRGIFWQFLRGAEGKRILEQVGCFLPPEFTSNYGGF